MMMILEAAAVAMTLREEGVGASAVRSKPVASVLPRSTRKENLDGGQGNKVLEERIAACSSSGGPK